jgi:glycerol uptake facilitator-like aquaporin
MAEATLPRSSPASARSGAAGVTLHWPEYLIEATCLGLFMVSACLFGTLFEHPSSLVRQAIDDPLLRRVPLGLAMGLTAIALIYSRLGQRSGAHMNPAVTLTFFRLGKVAGADTTGYVVAQFVGGIAGVVRASAVLGMLLASELYIRLQGYGAVLCAKLVHPRSGPCIFRCTYTPGPSASR